MERLNKTTTRITRTVSVALELEEIEEALKEFFGFDISAKVDWDADRYTVTGATIVHISVEEGEDK